MEEFEKKVAQQILQLYAPLRRETKDHILDDMRKMRDRDESVGCLPTVYLTGIAPETSAEMDNLRVENRALREQLEKSGIRPAIHESSVIEEAQKGIGETKRSSKLKKISSFHKLPEIKTPMLNSTNPLSAIPPLNGANNSSSTQTIEIEVVKHLQQGTGLLKRMRWSAPKIRVFKLSKDMNYLERESLNLISFEPTRIHLNHITAMESRTESTTDPELAEAGFCIHFDHTGRRQRKYRYFDLIAPTGADYMLWTKGLQMVLEARAASKSKGAQLRAELLELTLKIPVTMINHWYVHHFPEGCYDDGEEAL